MGEKFKASYEIHPEHDLVYMKLVGEVEIDRLVSFVKSMYADPAFKPGMAELADCSECAFKGRFHDMVHYVGARTAQVPVREKVRCATVLPSKELLGRGRIFAALHAPLGIEAEMFTDRLAAMKWLGVVEFEGDDEGDE